MFATRYPNRKAIIAEIRHQMRCSDSPAKQIVLQRCLDFWLNPNL